MAAESPYSTLQTNDESKDLRQKDEDISPKKRRATLSFFSKKKDKDVKESKMDKLQKEVAKEDAKLKKEKEEKEAKELKKGSKIISAVTASPQQNNNIANNNSNSLLLKRRRPNLTEIKIDPNSPDLNGPLGRVMKGRWIPYSMNVCLHEVRLRVDKNNATDKLNTTLRKVTPHPNLVRIFGMMDNYLVTEFLPLNPSNLLLSQISGYSDELTTQMIVQIGTGIAQLHSHNLVAINISLRNVFVIGKSFKLIGYCLSQDQMDLLGVGKIAPEITNNSMSYSQFNQRTDSFAFAPFICEAFAKRELTDAFNADKHVETCNVPKPLRTLVQLCASKDPNSRPDFISIVEHIEDVLFSVWENIETIPTTDEDREQLLRAKDQEIERLRRKVGDGASPISRRIDNVKTLDTRHDSPSKSRTATVVENRNNSASPVPTFTPSSDYQKTILSSWSDNKLIDWTVFSAIVCQTLQIANRSTLEEIRYIVSDDNNPNMVSKEKWEHLCKWFSPLVQVGNDLKGYVWNDILDVVKPMYFHGFLTAAATTNILKERTHGAFIIRFSSQPGCFSISVNNQGQIGHWRVVSDKVDGVYGFSINERKYTSLNHIVETHLLEPLKIKSDAQTTHKPIRLEMPVDRSSVPRNQVENVYSSLF